MIEYFMCSQIHKGSHGSLARNHLTLSVKECVILVLILIKFKPIKKLCRNINLGCFRKVVSPQFFQPNKLRSDNPNYKDNILVRGTQRRRSKTQQALDGGKYLSVIRSFTVPVPHFCHFTIQSRITLPLLGCCWHDLCSTPRILTH